MKLLLSATLLALALVGSESKRGGTKSKGAPSKVKPPKDKAFTVITGFADVPAGQTEVLRVNAPIYNDVDKTKEIGTFFLSCPIMSKTGFDIYNTCELYFYFHPAGAIQDTTDIITASGFSAISNISDPGQQPNIQTFVITGGAGAYLGARGAMYNTFKVAGLNSFIIEII